MTDGRAAKAFSLKVAEALPKDMGRGIARVDPEDIKRMGAEVGEIALIRGKRESVVKLIPAYPDARGEGIIQVDGITRENVQAAIGERVIIERVESQPATKLVLTPLTLRPAGTREADRRYLGRLVEGLPVLEGDRVRVSHFGARWEEFRVTKTTPGGAVTILPTTEVMVAEPEETAAAERSWLSYEDIGGLHKETQRIREMIELPMRYPQVFKRLGIEAPKGVLVHGPPGCGKTLIARAVAHETDAQFFAVSGPEVIHKFYGESEAKLRSIFEEATRKAPSIIFLDELDAIAPKREAVIGEVEKRVVAQLLALMDGLVSRGQVVVIGATNIPHVLDPALRRPGRFDREIAIGVPDRDGRKEILEIHTRGMPLAEDVDLEVLANVTHGFVGADLAALCREAAMNALRDILPQLEIGTEPLPLDLLVELEVTMPHFRGALREVEPSATREVYVERPRVRWEDVGGLKEVRARLEESIEWPLCYPELFGETGTDPPKGILLRGLPGTGKTLVAKALAAETEVNFISIKGPELLSKWVGESEKGVRELFKRAKQVTPVIVFIDEIDALVPRRMGGAGDSRVSERVVSQFLTELDGIEELEGITVIGATNRADLMEPALLRPGRFDLTLELPLPDQSAREEIFKIHLRLKQLARSVDVGELAQRAEGLSGAEIASICRRASMAAIRRHLDAEHLGKPDPKKVVLSKKDFEMALEEIRREGQ